VTPLREAARTVAKAVLALPDDQLAMVVRGVAAMADACFALMGPTFFRPVALVVPDPIAKGFGAGLQPGEKKKKKRAAPKKRALKKGGVS
jgi:hypothetical protein